MIQLESNNWWMIAQILRQFRVLFSVCFAFMLLPITVFAAQIYFLPQAGEMQVGDTFIGELRINTEGEQVNAFDLNLIYPSDLIEIVDVIKGGSMINLWIQEPSLESSDLVLQGGVTGGFSGEGLLLKMLFRAKASGIADLVFSPDSKVLLHDGRGTEAETSLIQAQYLIREGRREFIALSSNTHSSDDLWYSQPKKLQVSWDPQEGFLYSYILSRDLVENPDDVVDIPIGEVIYNGLLDGIYYFSIKESDNGGQTWSQITRRRFLHDSTPPENFEILIGQDDNGRNFATFSASDKVSGVDHYEVRETDAKDILRLRKTDAKWKVVESPYILEDQGLKSIIKVRALDKAGNERVEIFTPLIAKFWISVLIAVMILIIVFGVRVYKGFRI